jgi:tetratricopeptide (TPR) repeat protein
MRLSPVGVLVLASLVCAPAGAQDKPDALEMFRGARYADAVKICQQEIAVSPNNLDSYIVMGWSLLRLQQYSDAQASGQKAISISPNDPRIIQIIGEADVFLGRFDEALKFLQEYVALRPNGERIARVYWLMGECYIKLKEYQNADISISTAVYYEQNNPAWWARLGYARELANDLKWARDAYDHALKLDPALADALRGRDSVDKKLKGG